MASTGFSQNNMNARATFIWKLLVMKIKPQVRCKVKMFFMLHLSLDQKSFLECSSYLKLGSKWSQEQFLIQIWLKVNLPWIYFWIGDWDSQVSVLFMYFSWFFYRSPWGFLLAGSFRAVSSLFAAVNI